MRRQLIDPKSRRRAVVACGPAQERDLQIGEPDGGQSADEQGFEVCGQLFRAANCRGSIEEARRIVPPELGKRYSNIHDLTHAEAAPGWKHAGKNGPRVGVGDAECFAVPDDIDAAVGHNLQQFAARSREVVDPQAADVPALRRLRNSFGQ